MGIEARDVGILLWKILRFSTNIIYTYGRKYPIVSGVSVFISLLYIFLPCLFYFLLYSSPLIACSAFYLRNHLNSKPLATKTVNNESSQVSQKESEGGTSKADLKHQRSVRRNARRKVEEVGKDWDSSQASEDERDKVILTTLYGEIPNAQKSPKLKKFKKGKDRGFLVAEDFSFEPNLDEETSSTIVVDPCERLTSGETEFECSSSTSSSSEGEEESNREDKKVVAWTEDDQKNLMDLGNSEMERNMRLEHLITRRRTRRLFLLAAERSRRMDMDVPSICVGRNCFGLDQENFMIDGLHIPESAPSVLLPNKNPFDLPYDPQEEKPNLSGDSFQQEFSATNPNDMFYCHHESFCRRIFPSDIQLDSKMEPWSKSIDGWPRPLQGGNDGLVGKKPPLTKGKDLAIAEENDMESEQRTEMVVNDSNSLVSPGVREMDSNVSNQADSSGTSGKRNGDHRAGNSLAGMIPRNTGSLSSALAAERKIYMEHFGHGTGKGHNMTQSVESDLQVEYSEGSLPTTADGNNSSDEEKSRFVYESDTGKETGFSGEENEVKQKSIVDSTVESQMLPVEKGDQDFNETSSEISLETDAAIQLEGLSDGTDVTGRRSEEEERSKSRDSILEISDRGLLISEEATAPHTDEVISISEEELLQNSANQESEAHTERNDGGRTAQEMQEIVEPEASDENHVASDESATSPRSVLPPLDQTYTLTSENLEVTSDSQLVAVIPDPESPQNQLVGDRNSRETEGQSEADEEGREKDSSSDTQHETQASAITSN